MIYIWITIIIIILSIIAQIYLFFRYRRKDGEIIITEIDGKKLFSLELEKSPEEIANMTFIVFKVINMMEDDSFAE